MEVSEVFLSALNYERRARWKQAVQKYEKLITLLRGSKNDRINTNSYKLLLYECHVHCGVAYHHLDQTADAIAHYVIAMRVISRKKINCCVGCISGKVLHFHVPALAKISICHIQQGEYEVALKKVEEALVLDFKNPDLFCIRACIYFLLSNNMMAMKDVNFAIWLRAKHECAWLLRGIFKAKQKEEGHQNDNNTDFEMARSLEASVSAFTSLKDLSSSGHTILNRYLPSLRVSHTITPNDIFIDTTAESQTNKSGKSSASCRHQHSAHRCNNETKLRKKKEKENPRPKEPSGARILKFHEDSFLGTRTKSEPTLDWTDVQLFPTRTRTMLPREPSSVFQSSSSQISLQDYPKKTPFPSNGISVKDFLDVKVHRKSRPMADLGISPLGRVTSYPLTNERSLTSKAHSRRRYEEQERLYPRAWTQNQYPVRIPDIKGCRSTADLKSCK